MDQWGRATTGSSRWGFKRYGIAKDAALIARDISETASYFVFKRLPRLYGGVKREAGTFPVQYLRAS